jgi:hypothetical protein
MTARDDWAAIGDSIAGLALKLKLHFEETASESFEAAFDSMKKLVADPAVQQDLNDVAARLRDAVSNTFAELRTQLDRDDG